MKNEEGDQPPFTSALFQQIMITDDVLRRRRIVVEAILKRQRQMLANYSIRDKMPSLLQVQHHSQRLWYHPVGNNSLNKFFHQLS